MPKGSPSTALVPVDASQPPAKTTRPYTKRNAGGPRVPPGVDGIQSNFCRNIACDNFGIEPAAIGSRGPRKKGTLRDGYRLGGTGGKGRLVCTKCGQHSSLKSNAGIKEELDRISAYLEPPPDPSCPNTACANHGASALTSEGMYRSHGYTTAGSPRWRCKACGAVFSVRKANRDQLMSHKDAILFQLLVNKNSIRSMSRITGLWPQAIYDKIDFIHRQCVAFMADRERRIASLNLHRLYISTDRQDYVLNWSSRKDRKNTQLTAVASADNRSGYVFGMQTNFDSSIDTEVMEAEAIVAGDFNVVEPSFRKFARFWTTPDYEEAKSVDPTDIPLVRIDDTGDVFADIAAGYDEMDRIPDDEAKERPPHLSKLPAKGAQVHFEYTVHAHFRLLRRMLGEVGLIRFFMDQDKTLRAGCISTYFDEMRLGRADAFYVKIDKGLNVDQRQKLANQSRARLKDFKKSIGRTDMSDWWARVHLLEPEIQSARLMAQDDRWVAFPVSTEAEPLKAVCWLTDRSNVAHSLRHLAIIYARATMHPIDRYFMQIRRLLMALERPISTPSNDGRTWRGYSPYNPARVQKLLDIYRCFYNFVAVGKNKTTPAMRLGLAKGPISIEKILYFDPTCREDVAAQRLAKMAAE